MNAPLNSIINPSVSRLLDAVESFKANCSTLLALLPQQSFDSPVKEPLFQRTDQPDKKPETCRGWFKDAMSTITALDVQSATPSEAIALAQTAAKEMLAMTLSPTQSMWDVALERINATQPDQAGKAEQLIEAIKENLGRISQDINLPQEISQIPTKTTPHETAQKAISLMTALAERLEANPQSATFIQHTRSKSSTHPPKPLSDHIKDLANSSVVPLGPLLKINKPDSKKVLQAHQSIEAISDMKLINTQTGKPARLWDAVAEQLAKASGGEQLPEDKKLISDIRTHLLSLCDTMESLIKSTNTKTGKLP